MDSIKSSQEALVLAGLVSLGTGRRLRAKLLDAGVMPKSVDQLILGDWKHVLEPSKQPTHPQLAGLPFIYETLGKLGIIVLTPKSKLYPPLLTTIPHPPNPLFAKGNLEILQRTTIAIVGTRKPSHYGAQVVDRLVAGLSGKDVVLASGLALGIDGLVHRACLSHGIATVACIGSGLDRITPSAHARLAQEIISSNGLLISEYPLGTDAKPFHFPARNRIIAGMSQSTVVVEGARGSGSLITAEFAKSFSRQVFAVPGSIFNPMSEGPHQLLSLGARLLHSPDALVAGSTTQVVMLDTLSPAHRPIVTLLATQEALSQDEISQTLDLPIGMVQLFISELELQGLLEVNMGKVRLLARATLTE